MVKRILCALLASAFLLSTSPVRAADAGSESLSVTGKRVKVVAKSALYGFGGGLVVGLASQVFKKKSKNIFLFGSLGLYAGIIMGVYVITTSSGPAPYEGPDTYEDFSGVEKPSGFLAASAKLPSEEMRVNVLDVKF